MKPCKLLLALTLLLPSLPALAVPAQPGLTERHLPDGSVVNVRLIGDEFSHYMLSEDGWPLMEYNGTLRFAETDESGKLCPSSFNVATRNQATELWLSSLSKESLVEAAKAEAGNLQSARMKARRKNPGLHYSSFPHLGSPKALVILVEYSDVKCSTKGAGEYFSKMLNEPGFKLWGATGSARDYFIASSNGKFTPDFDFFGPVTLPNPMAYYGGNTESGDDAHAEDMVIHACQILDATVDFSKYDYDGDGLIDNVFIFYAGRGEASGGSADTVWPHSWDVRAPYPDTEFKFDGVQLGHYACTNEWKGDRPDGIGTFVHEFSHVLGLPDLYVTSGGTASFTPGSWDVLDYGPYSNLSRTPPAYSSYSRYALEWIEPKILTDPDDISLNSLDESGEACILFSKDNPNEYFLFENRQQAGWDKYLPGHGMLVWHVDYDANLWEKGGVNNNPSHHHVDLVEADNLLSDATRAGDAFPGKKGVTSYTATGHPAFKDWNGNAMPSLTEIAEVRKKISFKFDGGLPPGEAPEALPAADVESYSFKATWKPVADAENYFLTLSVGGEEEPLREITISGDSTAYLLADLAPETKYRYSVKSRQKGKGISAASNEIEVTTGEATLEWYAPQANSEAETGDTFFVGSWKALEGATEYFVSLFNKKEIVTEADEQNFDGGAEGLPEGWISSTNFKFDNANYAGKDVPALRFSGSGGTLESPAYQSDIHSVELWHRGLSKSEGNIIAVDALVDGNWLRIGEVTVSEAEGGKTDTIKGFPYGARAVKLSYITVGSNKGALALDDVCVNRELSFSKEIINGYDKKSVGNNLSARFEGLEPEKEYWFNVVATDGKYMSRESNPVRIITREKGFGGIDNISIGEEPVRWFNLQGLQLAAPPQRGVVIMVRGTKAKKIMIGR